MDQPAPPSFFMDGESQVDPARAVAHYCADHGFTPAELGIAPVVVATYSPQLTRFLAAECGAAPAERWAAWKGDGFTLGGAFNILTLPVGAPATVEMMEELIACGMRTLVVTGTAGSLQPDAPIGSLVLATSAVREEGTSHHYAPHDVPAEAHSDVVDAIQSRLDSLGIAHAVGASWTTDAIYREHRQKVDLYRRAGVISVEMVLSAIYIVGAVRGVRCGAILAVANELHGDEWEIGYGTDAIKSAMVKAGRVALHACARLAGIKEA